MSAPDVSVVIPTHNRCALVGRTLQSVLAQRDVSLEVLLVDDGSSDGTFEFLRQCPDPRVHVYRHESARGVSAARNTGLEHARGAWVAFLDDDDLWAPDKLAAQLGACSQQPGVGWVSTGAVVVDEELHVVGHHTTAAPERRQEILSYNYIAGGGSGVMARTGLVRSVGGFDVDLSNMADWDLWIRLALQAPLAIVHRPLVGYLRHAGGMSRNAHRVAQEFMRVISKYADVRAQQGITVNAKTLNWFARRQVRAGNRLTGARLYVHAAWQHGDWTSLMRALACVASPRVLSRRWNMRPLERLPAGWAEDSEAWLAPLRAVPSVRTGEAVPTEGSSAGPVSQT
jgi:glycosyltransferase involved in cell wall biosynthesis